MLLSHSGNGGGVRIVDLVLPLVERAGPELQALLDSLPALPGVPGPAGFSGAVTAIGVRIATVEPRIAALTLFAGSFVPASVHRVSENWTVNDGWRHPARG